MAFLKKFDRTHFIFLLNNENIIVIYKYMFVELFSNKPKRQAKYLYKVRTQNIHILGYDDRRPFYICLSFPSI